MVGTRNEPQTPPKASPARRHLPRSVTICTLTWTLQPIFYPLPSRRTPQNREYNPRHVAPHGLFCQNDSFQRFACRGACRLPPDLLAELQAIAGPRFAWERFSEGLREAHKKKGAFHHAKMVREYTPGRLIRWLQDETKTYFEETKAERFKLHNFRATAMSKARMAGIAESDAAIAFGCNPATMRQHYLALDEPAIADKVFEDLLRISGLLKGAENEKSTHA